MAPALPKHSTGDVMSETDIGRRRVLQGMSLIAGGAALASAASGATLEDGADWQSIRAAFPEQTPFLNLDNGCISPPPLVVQAEVLNKHKFADQNPCYNMFEVLDAAVPAIKAKLAQMVECRPDEIALNRCTTEGICTAIFGMPLARGDEVVLSNWDYPSMISAWRQRASREGIVLRFAQFGLQDGDDAIVQAYARMITRRTRAIHLTHMIHWSGRVTPVAEICDIARARGIRTVVDAAQSFAHIPVSFRQIGCDYLATSFHKWLSAPIGTGMLVVKASRVEETWPLYGTFEELAGADKFGLSNLGTFHSGDHYAIGDAIDFHNRVGAVRKQKRLQELSRYWVDKARSIPGFRIHTLMDHPGLGGLTTFSIDGMAVEDIERRLRDEFRIQTRKRTPAGFRGIRVSPQIYNTMDELDTFAAALRKIAASA
jgi:selenocysteine lyase/cysteine desulfurase